jgi:hypothetical protein
MSSQIFPHLENPLVAPEDRYDLSFAWDTLREVGELARRYSHRLTFHPSHFNQLGAVEGKVLDGTFADLKMHADILDAMGCDQVSGEDVSFWFRLCFCPSSCFLSVSSCARSTVLRGACQVNEEEFFGSPFRCLAFCLLEDACRQSAYACLGQLGKRGELRFWLSFH